MYSKYTDNSKDETGYLLIDDILNKIRENTDPNDFIEGNQKKYTIIMLSLIILRIKKLQLKTQNFITIL